MNDVFVDAHGVVLQLITGIRPYARYQARRGPRGCGLNGCTAPETDTHCTGTLMHTAAAEALRLLVLLLVGAGGVGPVGVAAHGALTFPAPRQSLDKALDHGKIGAGCPVGPGGKESNGQGTHMISRPSSWCLLLALLAPSSTRVSPLRVTTRP